MSGHDIHLMLKSKIEAMSYVGGVNVFDAEGNLINASAAWPLPPVNVADRPYFRTFKSDPQSPEMLVEPVYSRITGMWTTVIARKITGPKGEFLGAIGRGIEPTNFEKFFATVALGPGATIAMHHTRRHAARPLPARGGAGRQELQDRAGRAAADLRAAAHAPRASPARSTARTG